MEVNLLHTCNRLIYSPFVAVQNVCHRSRRGIHGRETEPPVFLTGALACFSPGVVVVAYVVAVVVVVVVEMVASFGKTAATAPRLSLPACPTCREIWDPSSGS